MKERLLDVIKWGLVLVIAGAIFYVVCPKYDFMPIQGIPYFRCNKITGYVEIWEEEKGWTQYKPKTKRFKSDKEIDDFLEGVKKHKQK